EAASADTDFRVSVHKVHDGAQGAGVDDGVGVEQKDVLGRVRGREGGADDVVVAAGEAAGGGELGGVAPAAPAVRFDRAAQAGGGITPGAVLADCDSGAGDGADLGGEGAQAVDRQVHDPVADDDDLELHRGCGAARHPAGAPNRTGCHPGSRPG